MIDFFMHTYNTVLVYIVYYVSTTVIDLNIIIYYIPYSISILYIPV